MQIKKNIFVPMADGVKLAIDLFTPDGDSPWPVILYAYPYHKDGHSGFGMGMDLFTYVSQGYAIVVADLRGTGSSEGGTKEPLDPLRGDDLYELVEWCGSQEWSNGNVGMSGESYGGMTALLAATGFPPSLKAIVAIMPPVNLYENLAFPGGTLNMLGICGAWINYMNIQGLIPPLYTEGRDDWKDIWKKRLDEYTPYLLVPMDHMTYDDYWKKHVIPVENITVPTYYIEGWRGFSSRDGFQVYQKLKGPKKLLIGPWVHGAPNIATFEPVEYKKETTRWFDYWLKGKDNGIMDEPPLSIKVMGAGFWKYDNRWPPEHFQEKTYHLHTSAALEDKPEMRDTKLSYAHDPAVGITAGLMTVFPLGIDYPKDQREDNARSLTFDTEPLSESVEIVGEGLLSLTLSTDMPDAAITAKLCDVDSDGHSSYITSGWLRLSHRESHEHPTPPKKGKAYEVTIELWPIDYQIQEGHRLRLCISLSDFPRVFPLPYQGKIDIIFGSQKSNKLVIPALIGEQKPEIQPTFSLPDLSIMEGVQLVWDPRWKVVRDNISDVISVQSGFYMEYTPLHMSRPIKLTNFYSANVSESVPDSAHIDCNGKKEFYLDKKNYTASVEQRVTQKKVEVFARIEEDGNLIYEKEFRKEYGI